MKNKTKVLLAGFIVLISAVFAVSKTRAATVSCYSYNTWPQQVIIDNIAFHCDSRRNYCNFDKAVAGIGECCANVGPYSDCVSVGLVEVNVDFPVDAWGYRGVWGACVDQMANRDQIDAFCRYRGYSGIYGGTNACWRLDGVTRWTWNGASPMVKGNNTGIGVGLLTVKCAKDANAQPVGPSCSDTDGGEIKNTRGTVVARGDSFTDTCSDGNTLLEGVCSGDYFIQKSITCPTGCSNGACNACAENWSCDTWSECLITSCATWPNCPNQQTRTCADSNNCGTTASKPAITQSCAVTCTDSDGGQNFNVKGDTTGIDTWKQYKNGTETDYCSGNSVTEFFCLEPFAGHPYINYSSMICPYGCADGACKACAENWSCGAWSTCSGGWQTRTCADATNCGTTVNKPATTQGCESLLCSTPIPGQEIILHYNGTSSAQFMCNSSYSHCKIDGLVGRCCPQTNSLNSDCMVMYPARTILQGDGAADKKTLTVGETWNVRGGLVLKALSIDARTNPRQVWMAFYKNGVKIDDKVASQGQFYLYTPRSYQNYVDFNLFGVYVDSIFAGATTDMVQLRYAYYNSLWENELSGCSESWSCGEWSACFNRAQTRTCTDANSCGTTVTKPTVSQGCSCTENWSCGAWSSCTNSQQTRTCTDSNNCGTIMTKPAISQSCCAENWSCNTWSSCFNNQQTRTCSDTSNCGTTVSKPITSQSCNCTESWSCGTWSACVNGQHSRVCVDFNNCGTTIGKPAIAQSCDITCTESWSCADWSACANNQQTRTCADSGNCGTTALKPLTTQICGTVSEPPTIDTTTPATPAVETVPDNAIPSTPINTTNAPPTELAVANPESRVFFGGVTAVSYLPGEVMKFYYKYQNVTEEPVKVKIVRQLVSPKGKVVASVQSSKTLKAGAALASNVRQTVAASLPAGVYTVKVKVYNAKNKVVDENSFPVELKKKYFVLNEMPADADIAWDAKVWSKVKTNAQLPVNLKLRFFYVNNTDAKHVVKMTRELIDENGKVKATKTSRWVMKVGEKDASTFTQWLGDNLPVGNYTLRLRAYDWTSKELLAENSVGFTVEAR